MGMILCLLSIDDDSITKVLADPPLIWKVIAPNDPEIYKAERGEEKGGSWFSRFFGKSNAPDKAEEIVLRPVEETDLDKSWHGIHYLLTKTAWEGDPPLNFLLLGGTEVGSIDVGYGTARAIDSGTVAEIDRELAKIDRDFLERQFDPAEMTRLGIYPEIWERNSDEDDMFGYCAEYFDDLKNFIRRAAENRLGLIIFLS